MVNGIQDHPVFMALITGVDWGKRINIACRKKGRTVCMKGSLLLANGTHGKKAHFDLMRHAGLGDTH